MISLTRAWINKPIITKLWSKYPKAWKYLLNIGLAVKYKTIDLKKLPAYIRLPSSLELHIDPKENRGRALLISNGITQERVVKFWERSVSVFSPTTVLDIGVNYGECLFSIRYPNDTKIYGVEANEHLLSYINKSLSEHPNKNQMNIVHAFASNQENETQEFYVDKNWSGTSSGKEIYSKMVEKHLVQTITIDALLIGQDLSKARILFKIDVEGYEAFVIEGMENVIRYSKGLLGILEFDTLYMQNSGTDINLFLEKLTVYFHVYAYNPTGELLLLTDVTLKGLQKIFKARDIHTDLVLVKPGFDIGLIK